MAGTTLFYGFIVAVFLGCFLDVSKACFCLSVYEPVCGTNGVTYSNECMLQCAAEDDGPSSDVMVASYGRCGEEKPEESFEEPDTSCPCSREYIPACGINGRTYANRCLVWCAGILVAYDGLCKGTKKEDVLW